MGEAPLRITSTQTSPGEPPRISSEELFRGARTIVIAQAGENYRLLITRNNLLILQK